MNYLAFLHGYHTSMGTTGHAISNKCHAILVMRFTKGPLHLRLLSKLEKVCGRTRNFTRHFHSPSCGCRARTFLPCTGDELENNAGKSNETSGNEAGYLK